MKCKACKVEMNKMMNIFWFCECGNGHDEVTGEWLYGDEI